MDELLDWRCPNCGLIARGSLYDPAGGEVARTTCRFCQAPKPDRQDWRYVADGDFYELPAEPA